MNPIKAKCLRALSGAIPPEEMSLEDYVAQIDMNEQHGTTYCYGREKYHEPLAESGEAVALTKNIMREHDEGMTRIRKRKYSCVDFEALLSDRSERKCAND